MASLDGFNDVHALALMLEDMEMNDHSPRNRPLNNTNNSNSSLATNNNDNENNSLNNNSNPNNSQENVRGNSNNNNISLPLASEPIPIPRSQQSRAAGRQRMRSESIDLEPSGNNANESGRETEEEVNNCANLENSPRISSRMQTPITPPLSPPQIPLDISELECSLCFRLFYQPVTTACGHSFCKPCLFSALKYSANCPLCRYRIVNKSSEAGDRYGVNIIINNLIERYFPEEYHARLEEEELWKLEKKKRAKEERMMQDDENAGSEENNSNNVSSSSTALSSPSNWYHMIVPSVRGTCSVLLSCGGF